MAGVVLLATSACAPRTHHVLYSAGENRVLHAPSHIAVGDSVFLVVRDSAFQNTYGSRADTSAVVVADRAAMFGTVDFGVLASGIPVTMRRVEPATALLPLPSPTVGSEHALHGDAPATRRRARAEAARLRALIDSLERRRDTARRDFALLTDSLRLRLLASPDDASFIRLFTDSTLRNHVARLARDSTIRLADRVLALGAIGPIPESDARHLRARALAYGRDVAALGARLSPTVPFAPDREVVNGHLERLRSHDDRARALARQIDSLDRSRSALLGYIWEPAGSLAAPRRPFVVAGLDLASLVWPDSADSARVRVLTDELGSLSRGSRTVFVAANRAPSYVVSSVDQRVFVGRYWNPVRIRVTPSRGPRFPDVVSATTPLGPGGGATKAPATSTSSTTVGTVNVNVTVGEAKKEESSVAAPLAGVDIDVLPRARFHLGAGVMYSRLASSEFLLRADTVSGVAGTRVVESGRASERYGAVAVLGVSLIPSGGKVFGGQAYDLPRTVVDFDSTSKVATIRRLRRSELIGAYLRQAGLAAAIGLSLDRPLESFTLGLQSEPLPGVHLGVGRHIAYVGLSQADSSGFVPLSRGAAVRNEWRSATSVSVALDASTILAAFGKLLGIK